MWEEKYHCKVISATRDSFQDMFDDDLTLEYEPVQTAAIILTGGDEEAEQAALAVRFKTLNPKTSKTPKRPNSEP